MARRVLRRAPRLLDNRLRCGSWCADRGCTNGFQGAFVDSTAAKAAAAEAEAADILELSYWAIEVDVE